MARRNEQRSEEEDEEWRARRELYTNRKGRRCYSGARDLTHGVANFGQLIGSCSCQLPSTISEALVDDAPQVLGGNIDDSESLYHVPCHIPLLGAPTPIPGTSTDDRAQPRDEVCTPPPCLFWRSKSVKSLFPKLAMLWSAMPAIREKPRSTMWPRAVESVETC